MECDECCMIWKMKDSKESSTVSRAPVANLRRVKIFVPEDHPTKAGVKSRLSCSDAVHSKNSLAWYVALNSKPLERKISLVPQIKWKCPTKLALDNHWHVAAGEGSQEAKAKKCGETTVQEVVYPPLLAIPPSPFTSPHNGGAYCDDSRIPVIPTTPIEEAAVVKMPFDTSAPVNTCINSQPPASPKGPPVSRELPSTHCSPSGPEGQHVKDKSLPDILCGLESGDLEVAAAAAATVAAVMESKEQIDTKLLIKFLTDPEMVKKLMDENGFKAKPPAAEPNTFFPLPSSTPASVVDKRANECSGPLSRAVPSNSRPQAVNKSLALPCAKVEPVINKSANQQGGVNAGSAPICTSKPVEKSSPLPRSNSDVPPIRNLTLAPGGPAHSHIHQVSGVKQVKHLMPSNLRPDEETIKRLIKQYGAPDVVGVTRMPPHSPSTSKPNMDAIKKMINEYGAPDAGGIRPIASTSRSPNVEEMTKMINEYGVPDHGSSKPFLVVSTPFETAMVMPPAAKLHVLPNTLGSNLISTGIFHFPSSSPVTLCAPPVELKDLNYYKSLIKKHGEKHETEGHHLPILGQPANYLRGLELARNTTSISIEMNPKYQKPCVYFSSSKGCWNGINCPYQHDVSMHSKASQVVGAPVAKKMKFSDHTGKL